MKAFELFEADPNKPRVRPENGKYPDEHWFSDDTQHYAQKPKEAPKASDPNFNPIIKAAFNSRKMAQDFLMMLGSIYQSKRTNPAVDLSEPRMVTAMKDGPQKLLMRALYDKVKDKKLPEIAALTQEIKKATAANPHSVGPNQPAPPKAQAPAGQGGQANTHQPTAPVTPGQTHNQNTLLQQLLDLIRKNAKNLSPDDVKVVRKELNNQMRRTKRNPAMKAGAPAQRTGPTGSVKPAVVAQPG